MAPKGDIYLMVDLAPFFTKADFDDYGDGLKTVMFKPGKPDFIMGFPEGLYPNEFTIMGNGDMFEAARDRLAEVPEVMAGPGTSSWLPRQKMTDPAKEQYGYGNVQPSGYGQMKYRGALMAGMPDSMNGFGNCWQWSGDIIAETAQFVQDMLPRPRSPTRPTWACPPGPTTPNCSSRVSWR